MKYNVFGSENSIDKDIVVFLNSMPKTIEDSKKLCKKIENEMGNDTNANLAFIKDGIISKCFKGTPDEVNNSVFYTYVLHDQDFDLQVKKTIKRNVPLKIARSLRIILTLFSRTKYRKEIKKALKKEALDKLKVLEKIISFNDLDFNKNGLTNADIWKNIAFQMIQTRALIEGKEIYTKNDAIEYRPNLTEAINREQMNDSHFFILNSEKSLYCSKIKEYAINQLIKE